MARRRRRLRAARAEGLDEAAGLSGWLYTDLLLGLFVVFIGAVAFTALTFGSSTDAVEDGGLPAPSTSSTTTTTTVPEQICTRLLSARVSRADNSIFLARDLQGDALSMSFTAELKKKIDEINARPETEVMIDFEEVRIGMVLASGGNPDVNAGQLQADEMESRLRSLFDGSLLSGTVFRNGGTSRTSGSDGVPSGQIRLEIFPLVEASC